MPSIGRSENLVRFEGFELNLRTGELRKDGDKTLRLSEQPLRILIALLERPGDLVLREDLRKRLWPNDTVVEFEHGIGSAVNRLRQALGDAAENPHFIETLARRGYRWKTPVEWIEVVTEDSHTPPAFVDQNLLGKRVAHYRVLELLGGGGMGLVYKAEDIKLGRRVALKFLPEELAADPVALERLKREARAASAPDHPNVCTIYEIGEHEGMPFIAMQLLQGQTLSERMESRTQLPFPTEELIAIAIQVVDGLDAAHREGIIHRDIKPANIFVTNRNEVKLLDFGLAKLADATEQVETSASRSTATGGASAPALSLSRSGVTMGTAAYMSPEQVRGEKVDARTDLFSFGLVLYEMATGKRAFGGETAQALHDAILMLKPSPVREINARLPLKIEQIINRALQKDREARYQTAAQMRSDLEIVKRKGNQRTHLAKAGLWAVVIALFIVTAVFWFAEFRTSSHHPAQDLKLRQLTINSGENRVTSGAISPDGKYLAYSDRKGMHVKLIRSNEAETISPPKGLENSAIDWQIVPEAWFPDSETFLANAYPPGLIDQSSKGASIWMVSVLGGVPRKFRDNAVVDSVSRDGLIAFLTNQGRLGDREIWLTRPGGQEPHKLLETDENSRVGMVLWSPDGRRILYKRTDESGQTLIVKDLQGGSGKTVIPSSEMINNTGGLWLPDGRLIFSVRESGITGDTCNFWVMKLDERTGQAAEKPRRLTNFAGVCPDYTSATHDGRRLTFLQSSGHGTGYVADLAEGGTRISNPRHFTLDESDNLLTDWTPDGKTVILLSNRDGHYGIYKQSLNAETPELMAANNGGLFGDARLSPDGRWIIAIFYPDAGSASTSSQLMRVPMKGGLPEVIFPIRSWGYALCAKAPSSLCVLAEATEDRKEMTVTSFDPVKGRGPVVGRFDLDTAEDGWLCAISPHGTHLAAIRGPAGPIQIRSLKDGTTLVLRVGLDNIRTLDWAADGQGLFVSHATQGGSELLHVDLQGNTNVLWKTDAQSSPGRPSPDGRYLAIYDSKLSTNIWLMENF